MWVPVWVPGGVISKLLKNNTKSIELADRETRKSVRQIVSKALDFLLII